MSTIDSNAIVEPAAVADSNPAATRPDVESRKALRLQELSGSALEKADPKQALLGMVGAESLELLGLMVGAVRPAVVQIADAGERLKLLRATAASFANLAKLGEKLA